MSGIEKKVFAAAVSIALATPALALDLGGGGGIGGTSIGGGVSIGGGGASGGVGASTGGGGISGGGGASISGGGVSAGGGASIGGGGVSAGGGVSSGGGSTGDGDSTGLGSGNSSSVGRVLSRNRVTTVEPGTPSTEPYAASMMGRAVMSSDDVLLGHVVATRTPPGNACPTLGLSPNPALSLPQSRVWLTLGSCRRSASSRGALRVGTSSQAFLRAVY